MNATEDNKLIAKFMGMTYGDPNDDSVMIQMTSQGNEVLPIESMKYHISWDWLMPVVESIRNVTSYDIDRFSTEVIIYGDKTSIKSKGYGDKEHSKSFFNKSIRGKYNSIEHTYKAVLEYVEWHNTKH